jgi:hypothetical protein
MGHYSFWGNSSKSKEGMSDREAIERTSKNQQKENTTFPN